MGTSRCLGVVLVLLGFSCKSEPHHDAQPETGGKVVSNRDAGGGNLGDAQAPPTKTDAAMPSNQGKSDGAMPNTMPMAPPGTVGAFMAQGHVGRTLLSCDDGRTWVVDRSFDREGDRLVCDMVDPVTCFEMGSGCQYLDNGNCVPKGTQCDCDHHPGAGLGVAYGDGWFVATWGWGPHGGVRRTRDGVVWEEVLMDTTFGGIAFGNGRFLVGDLQPRRSLDAGETWQNAGLADLRSPAGDIIYNVRTFGFAPVAGGRFVITGESGSFRDVLVSSDGGDSFVRPSVLPPECAKGAAGIAGSSDTIIITHTSGLICYSHDGGDTFATTDLAVFLESRPVWAGDRFMTWSNGKAYSSSDGENWTTADTHPANINIGAVAYNPETGTLVGVRGGWQVWYDQQVFYRSSDGINWTALSPQEGPGGHPILHMTFGYVEPSSDCPAP